MKEIKKVVLAYSGGLDTSIIIPWLKENYNNCEVIAVSADVGQGTELDGLEEKAKKTGASKLYILDLKKEFVEDYIYPTMQAGAVYEGDYLLLAIFSKAAKLHKSGGLFWRISRFFFLKNRRRQCAFLCLLLQCKTRLPPAGSNFP